MFILTHLLLIDAALIDLILIDLVLIDLVSDPQVPQLHPEDLLE